MCIHLFQKHLKTPDIVIGADTIVVRGRKTVFYLLTLCNILYMFFIQSCRCFPFPQTVDGMILEKPVDKEDAYRMLSR